MKKLQITLIILLAVITGLVGGLAYFTDGFADWSFDGINPTQRTLQLTVDGKTITELTSGENIIVEVQGVDNFTVSVVPGDKAFDFRHNGALVKFPYIDKDITAAFGVEKSNGSFRIILLELSMQKILQALYPGEEITDISAIDKDAVYFIVRVTGDGQTVELPVRGFYAWMSIELDKPEMVF